LLKLCQSKSTTATSPFVFVVLASSIVMSGIQKLPQRLDGKHYFDHSLLVQLLQDKFGTDFEIYVCKILLPDGIGLSAAMSLS
jgi:hypothetical protein